MKPEGHAVLRRQEGAALRRSANRPLPVGVQEVVPEDHQSANLRRHPSCKVDEAAHKVVRRHVGDCDRRVVARSAPILRPPHFELAVLVGLAHWKGGGEECVTRGRLFDGVDVPVVGDRRGPNSSQPLWRLGWSKYPAQPLLGDELKQEFLGVLVDPRRVDLAADVLGVGGDEVVDGHRVLVLPVVSRSPSGAWADLAEHLEAVGHVLGQRREVRVVQPAQKFQERQYLRRRRLVRRRVGGSDPRRACRQPCPGLLVEVVDDQVDLGDDFPSDPHQVVFPGPADFQ